MPQTARSDLAAPPHITAGHSAFSAPRSPCWNRSGRGQRPISASTSNSRSRISSTASAAPHSSLQTYDIYDQCFHNLDIVWFWGSLQPIDTQRITDWDRLTGLTRRAASTNMPGAAMAMRRCASSMCSRANSSGPSRRATSACCRRCTISTPSVTTRGSSADPDHQRESWAWLLDPRAKGRIALVDEPAIGIFDVALAAEAAGQLQFADIGNMTVAEVDALMAFLNDLRQQGYFRAVWRNAEEAGQLIRDDQVSAQSMWSPVYGDLGAMAGIVAEAVPIEGYRAWHGGIEPRPPSVRCCNSTWAMST